MTLQAADAQGGSARGPLLKEKWRLCGRTNGKSLTLALCLSLSLLPQFRALGNMITYEHLTDDGSACWVTNRAIVKR